MTTQANPYRKLNAPTPTPRVARTQRFRDKRQEQLFDGAGDFNPQAYGGWSPALQRAIPGSSRMFDKTGQINAQDNKDALTQIAYLMQHVAKGSGMKQFYRPAAETMPAEERRQILTAALKDRQGFEMVGQQLAYPIKEILDYEGWARKILRNRVLDQAELFRIPKDVRSTAWVIGQDGQGIESRLYGKWIQPQEFKVASFPSVDIADIHMLNFDVLDRAQDTARQEIELEEDRRAQALLDRAAQTVNATVTFATLGIAAFEDVRFQVERHRLHVGKFLIARAELSDIVKTMSAAVDPVTERELILAGYIGNILNAQIITAAGTDVEEVVPAGTFYAVTDEDYLGEFATRIELFSEPYDKYSNQETVKGWAFVEMIGMGIPNSKAVARGVK